MFLCTGCIAQMHSKLVKVYILTMKRVVLKPAKPTIIV